MSKAYSSIQVSYELLDNPYVRRVRSPFNDKRLYRVYKSLLGRFVEVYEVAIRQLSFTSSEAKRYYRFLNNKRIKQSESIRMACGLKASNFEDKHILVLGDSSSFNLNSHKGRLSDISELGVLNDNRSIGFHIHVHLALDAEKQTVTGLADVLYWVRKKKVKASNNSTRSWEEKESYRWKEGASNASHALQGAKQLTYVYDQEADHFDLFHYLHVAQCSDFIIRCKYNRRVKYGGEMMHLDSCLSAIPAAATYELHLPKLDHYSSTSGKRIKRKKRTAIMEIRYVGVEVMPACDSKATSPMKLYMVQAKEVGELPEGEEPILWRLWTSLEVKSLKMAQLIILYYTLRWIIEQLFRTMKKKGFNLEATQLESFPAILRQTTMAFKAACTILQLTYARDKPDAQLIEQVFEPIEQEVLQRINQQLQGKTDKLRNPFSKEQLSWAAWVIARLGGWKGNQAQRKPGPITFKIGLHKFQHFVQAFHLFNSS